MAKDPNKNAAATTLSDGEIIDRFGGIRPMAAKLGVAFTTVQGWKVRGHIPAGRRQAILDAAAKHGIDLGGGAATPAKRSAPEPGAKAVPAKKAPASTMLPPTPPREKPAQPETPADPSADREKTAPTPEAPAAPQPRGGAGVAWLALLAALAVGVALIARPVWEPLIYPPGAGVGGNAQSAETVAEIRKLSRVVEGISTELTGRLDALEGRTGGGDLDSQLAPLERSLSSLASGLESIGATLAGLEARIAALESSKGVPARVETALRENAAALAALKQELAGLEEVLVASRAKTDGLREELAAAREHSTALRGRVEELESRPVQTGEKIAALALAVGQVEAAFNSGKPYRNALNGLEAIARDDPLILDGDFIAALSPSADDGIPTRGELQRHFAGIAPDITRALDGPAGEESDTLAQIWHSVTGLVTVRRTDGDMGPVSRAEAALADDDLAAAIAALAGAGSLGDEGDAWLNLAKNRIRAEQAITALYARAIQPLAGAANSTPGQSGAREGATQ